MRQFLGSATNGAWLLGAMLAVFAGQAFAQNVTVNPGTGSYPTLADAFAAINAGTHTGTVTVNVVGDTTEPVTGAVLVASGTGAASYTSILISPTGARTISGAATAGLPLVDLNGADNVTIDGLNSGGNSLTISNTTVSATSATSTIRLIGGATNNTITNATIRGSASMAVATNGGTIFISTDANTPNGNDGNTISNNNIGPAGSNLPTKAISCNGSQTTTALGNSGIVVSNNNIFDYFGAAVTSSGIHVANGCNNWQITNNRLYQTGLRTWTTGAMHRAIDINSSSATFGAQGFTIAGNVIGYDSATQTGTYALSGSTGKFNGIFLSAINNAAGIAPSVISNNTIASISMTGVTSSGTGTTGSPIIGIMANNGSITTDGNTIGSQGTTGSIVLSTNTTTNLEVYGIYNFSVDNWTARNNTIGGFNLTNAGSGSVIFYGLRANTGTAVSWLAENNIVGGTVANSIQTTASGTGSALFGMASNNAITTATANTVRNLTSNAGTGTGTTASIIGMLLTSTGSAGAHVFQRNTISNLSNTNATAAVTVTGMQLTGPTGFTNTITRNSISNLSVVSSSAAAAVNGVNFGGGLNNLSNNFIRLGQDAAGADVTAGIAFSGINELLGTNVFNHNTVLVQGSGVAGTLNSFALNSTVTVNNRSYRNNVFVNTRSNGSGTGKHYAARFGGSTPLPTGLSANNNLYFVNGTGGVLGFFNLLDHPTLNAFQAATGVDIGSISADPAFVSTTNLRLTSVSPARDVGSATVGVTVDFDGKSRPGANTLFDMGADEFDGILPEPNDIAATAFIDPATGGAKPANVAFAPSASFTNVGTLPQTAIPVRYRILDAGNVEVYNQTTTIATLAPLVAATATFANATLPAGTYTIIAVAELAADTRPTNNTITGTLQVLPPLSGVYTVGAGGDFASLTNPNGAFDRVNGVGGTGSVRFNILGDLSGETGAIVLNTVQGGATVSIRPASGVTALVSGSINGCLLRLNGADNVTIDGSNTDGGMSRDLSFQNTSTGTAAGVICVSSLGLGAGATNNTIRNVNVSGSDPTTSLLGISVGGQTSGSSGANNNGTRIENVSVRRAIFGIFVSGDSTSLTTGTVIRGNDLTGTGADRIRRVGILVFNDDGTQIIGNRVGGIDSTESADSIGIGLGLQDANATATLVGGGVINALVAQNEISSVVSGSATGFSAVGIAVGGATGTNTVANNMIRGVIAPSTSPDFVAGIFVGGSATATTRVVHNSILLSGDRGTVASQTPAFGVALTGTSAVEMRNNIIVNSLISGGGTNALSFLVGTGATTFANLSASNNLYNQTGAQASGFRSGGLTAAAGGTVINHATLAAWQAATGGEVASQQADPQFVSATDLHIQPGSSASNAGVAVAGVNVDFDGQARSPTTPEIGADELPFGELGVNPSSVSFGSQELGSTSASQTVTLSNTGSGPLTVSDLSVAASPFAAAGGTCGPTPITLGAGASCTLQYTFAPTALGAATQSFTVTTVGKGSGSFELSGTGIQGNLAIAPTAVDFGNTLVGSSSAEQSVTLSNTGTASLNVTALSAAAAPFERTATGSCAATLPITLAAGSSCTLSYRYSPTATGAAGQILTVTANAPGSGTIALAGTGIQGNLTITPTSVGFGNVNVGSTSPEQTVTLANTGTASLEVTALTTAAAPFARTATGSCAATLPITLAAGASCTLTYSFAPTAVGAANQSLTVTANAPGSGTIALAGTGVSGALAVSPNPVLFGNQRVGTTSAATTVTLTNAGDGSLTISALPDPAMPFARSGGSCGALPITLAAGDSCTVQYTFAPTATGAAETSLTITSAAGGSNTLQLTGTGIQGNLVLPANVVFPAQPVGSTSAPLTATLSNSGTDSLEITALTAAAAPFSRSGGTCPVSLPFPLAAGASCTLLYTFAPTAPGDASQSIGVTANVPGSGSFTLSGTGAPSADLSIVKTSNVAFLGQGLIQYTLVVGNAGPSAVTGATVTDVLPAALQGVVWTCTGINGGGCAGAGSGNISQSVNLPVGAAVVYSISGTVPAPIPNEISNTATVAVPTGVTDPVAGNNSSTVTNVVRIFVDGFEAAPTQVLDGTGVAARSIDLPAPLLGSAARSASPEAVAQYRITGHLAVVQVRRIAGEVQAQLLTRDPRGLWQVSAWQPVTTGTTLRFEWQTGAEAGGVAPLSARLVIGS